MPNSTSSQTSAPLTALVVARQGQTQQLCQQALTLVAKDVQVSLATSYDQALQALVHHNYGLCICFEPLDAFSAIELLQQTRRQGSEAPFIAVLHNAGLAADSAAMWAGAADVLALEQLSIAGLARSARHALIRQYAQQQLREQARTDFLTGAANRRVFQESAERELGRVEQCGGEAAILLLDVDKLKATNDLHGHKAGDLLLQAVTQICQDELRPLDVFARYGGDEFALLAPDTDMKSASRLAARILRRTENYVLEFDNALIEIGLSIGIATTHQHCKTSHVLEAADAALMQAKAQGRGQVACAGEPSGQQKSA